MNTDTVVIVVGLAILLLFLLGIGIYTWACLNRDIKIFKQNRDSLLQSSALPPPEDGEDGEDGEDAYNLYLADHPSEVGLTLSQYEARFTAIDGLDGLHAPPAIDGSHGEDGSTGLHGDTGISGAKGTSGNKGLQGLEGDSFLTVYVSTPNTLDIIQDTNTSAAPTGYPCCAFMYSSHIRYFYQGSLLANINVASTNPTLNGPDAYISFLIYKDSKIIGMTEPLTIVKYNPEEDVTVSITGTSGFGFRAILSYNNAMVRSSFTQNIIENNLLDESFIYSRSEEQDPFIKQFYTIISNNPSLNNYDIQFLDKTIITKMEINMISPFKLGV